MATAKKTQPKPPVDDLKIIEIYMDDVLSHNAEPGNVYQFCKRHNIEETQFYTYFASIDGLKQEIWVRFFENAETIIMREPAFATYASKDKLLTFYFTLFEILTLNRTYVSFSLKDNGNGLRNLRDLSGFRKLFKSFTDENIRPERSEKNEKLRKVTDPVLSEGIWLQFLFLLKFWLDDTSKGFEKTDIAIEKTVNTAASFTDTKPLENLFDLGKFLWNG